MIKIQFAKENTVLSSLIIGGNRNEMMEELGFDESQPDASLEDVVGRIRKYQSTRQRNDSTGWNEHMVASIEKACLTAEQLGADKVCFGSPFAMKRARHFV